MNEKISALIDQQGNPRQRQDVFDRVLADDGARRVWQRYHLIGCVLRGEVEQIGADLSERIRTRLEDEPTVLAPAEPPAPSRPGIRTAGRKAARITSWKSAGLLALAASVALAAVIVLQPAGEERVNPIAGGPSIRFQQEVGEMLAQHGEFTSSPGLNGLVVYAKLVSNEPIER